MARPTIPLILPAAIVTTLVLSAGPAGAHGGVMPGTAPPGATTELSFVLAHGCGPDGTVPATTAEALATTAVTLTLPREVAAEPTPTDGWAGVADPGPAGKGGTIRWTPTGAVDPAAPVFLGLVVTIDDVPEGTELLLPTVQECEGDEVLHWTDTDGAHAAAFPAPALTVSSAAVASGAVSVAGPSFRQVALAAALVALVSLAGGYGVWRRMAPPPAELPSP